MEFFFLLVGGGWFSFTPGLFTPGARWIGDWLGYIAGLDDFEKGTIWILPGLELRTIGRLGRSQ
jgi:hypothetical protein